MKPKGIFILEPAAFEKVYGPEERRDLHALVDMPDCAYSPKDAQKHPELLRDVELIFSSWGGPRLDAAFLETVPQLKAFFYGAGSIKEYVTEEFWQRDIPITSAASANAVPVVEFAHAEILLSLKRVWSFARDIRQEGAWPDNAARGNWVAGAYGSTVGVISLGIIGRLVCERLKTSEVKVIAYDPFVTPERAKELGVELVSLEELFRRSDVVSLHAPLLEETKNMITKELLATMKQGATFINTARGKLINEKELVEVLRARPDLFALLDVTAPEPPEKGSPLFTLPNVVLTPHIAGSINNECRRMGRLMIEETERYLKGQALRWRITPQMALITA